MPKFKVNTKASKSFYLKDENEIQRGGEGRILLIDSDNKLVAKIYHQNKKTISESKFNYLQKLDAQFFIKPVELIFIKSKIIGYTMEFAGKDFFPVSSLFSKNFCKKNKITFKIKKLIATQLIDAVKQAHSQDITVGDLNQFNILTNKKGIIKLIDTDSYQTPKHKHNGLLLDDIRDYLFNGIINKNSDYFALSVIVFYLFTYTHPFKGIHKKIKKLSDRMINKLPIFKKDSDIIIPKCYEAIQDKKLQANFEKLYLNGDRFLISIADITDKQISKISTIKSSKIEKNDVIISTVVQNEAIVDVLFHNELGIVETETKFIVFSAKNRGYLNRKFVIDKNNYEQIYIGNKNIFVKKAEKLFVYENELNIKEISNFRFSNKSIISQKENILFEITTNYMNWIYLDDIFNTTIKIKRTEVFGEGFSNYNGLLQNTGGVLRVFYNTGKDIATVKTKKIIKQIYQKNNFGIIQTVDNKIINNYYFKIKGLNIKYATNTTENFTHFAIMKSNTNDGFIFEPENAKIKVIRTQDFNIVSEINCKYISEQTNLFYTKSGIIAWENDSVLLINTK